MSNFDYLTFSASMQGETEEFEFEDVELDFNNNEFDDDDIEEVDEL